MKKPNGPYEKLGYAITIIICILCILYLEGIGVGVSAIEIILFVGPFTYFGGAIGKWIDKKKSHHPAHPNIGTQMDMEEKKSPEEKLPKEILDKAYINKGNEYAWRQKDIHEVLQAAKIIGLACLGGQPQFRRCPILISELNWINYDPEPRMENESWEDYSKRSIEETLVAFNKICAETDFLKEAMNSEHIKNAVKNKGINPLDYLWFVLYFEEKKS